MECGRIFKFAGFKRLTPSLEVGGGITKYYDNDGIAFELYSTILCRTSNQIVRAVDLIYKNHQDAEEISRFVENLNHIIIQAVNTAIKQISDTKQEMIDSKYHTLYVLTGIIFSNYDVDVENLSVKETKFNEAIFHECLDLKKHIEHKWFTDENRQIDFFKIKVGEMLDLKMADKEENHGGYIAGAQEKEKTGILELRVNGQIISAYTVKDFYRKIFDCLYEQKIDFDEFIPYATGRKRYLINRVNRHINGNMFVSPIVIRNYYVETHKSKTTAIMDIRSFLQKIGVEAEYV